MKKYCLGFYFSEGFEQVLLVKKNRPASLIGKFNGIGGLVEEGERERHAMIREFREETGIDTHLSDWYFAGSQKLDSGDQIYIFYGIGDLSEAMTMTDEIVHIVPLDGINNYAMDDLSRQIINHIIEDAVERKISKPTH